MIAIGGIGADNILSLQGSGICGIAVVSAIFAAKDIEAATKVLKDRAEKKMLSDGWSAAVLGLYKLAAEVLH